MRNKIYTPDKGWINIGCWLALCAIGFYVATTKTAKSDLFERIAFICLSVILLILACIEIPILTVRFFVVYDDKIIFRSGTRNSRCTPFKTYTLSIKEIVDLQLVDVRQYDFITVITSTHITLSDGQKYTFSIEGYFNKDEIKRLMYDVQEQIKARKR